MNNVIAPIRYCRVFFLVFLSIACFLAVNPVRAEEQQQTWTKGILWKIEGGKSSASYLLGTIHIEDPRILKLPEPVKKIMQSCSSFSLEIIPNIDNQIVLARNMLFTDGRTLEEAVGRKVYTRIVAAARSYNIPEMNLALMKPWAVMLTLSLPKPRTGQVLDFMLYKNAKQAGKRTYGLETIYEQIMIFDSLKLPDQITLLKEALNNFDQLPEIIEKLTQAYLARDLAKLVVIAEQYEGENKLLSKKLRYKLLDKRNRIMVQRMRPRLREGNACFAIGALHLPGKAGLLSLLAKRGYRLTAVY